VVTDRRAALDMLHDDETWSHDPRAWEATLPQDAEVPGMLSWRPNVTWSDGDAHIRYRTAIIDASTWSSRTTCASGCTTRSTCWSAASVRRVRPTWSPGSPGR